MFELSNPDRCEICGASVQINEKLCLPCSNAFESAHSGGPDHETLELSDYSIPSFPWEAACSRVGLIRNNRVGAACVVVLVILIVLLAVLRAPLPSCWEISS
jgi:hypothetical protein